jgi:hypothetical protein
MLSSQGIARADYAGDQHELVDFQPCPTAVLDARQLKVLLKSSGHKLSANAFDALNRFIRQFALALALSTTRPARADEWSEDSASTLVAGVASMEENVAWSSLLEAGVRRLVPALEGWSVNWYERLGHHVECFHEGLPESFPCCGELPPAGAHGLLLDCGRLSAEFRAALMRTGHTANWYATGAVCCGLNEVVQWVIGVALKMMDAKGVGTLKRADVLAIVERAPIFAGLQAFVQDAGLAGADVSGGMSALGFYEPVLAAATEAAPRPPAETRRPRGPVAEEMSVAELARLVNERLRSAAAPPAATSTAAAPAVAAPTAAAPPVAVPTPQTRYVVCSDRHFPWMQVCRGEALTLLQSTGVQTDLVQGSAAPPDDGHVEAQAAEIARLREEVQGLKALLKRLLDSPGAP